PMRADTDTLVVVGKDRRPERVAVVHATDPALAALLQDTACDLRDSTATATLLVLRSGTPQLREACDPSRFDSFLARTDLTDAQRARLHELQPRSYLAVPLLARGRCLGVLTLLYTAVSNRHYDGGDLARMQHLATRIGAFLEI